MNSNNLNNFFIKYKKYIILFLPVVIILITFNGFLNPYQIRVFGDTYPETISHTSSSYEFFKTDFDESITPNYYAPFRYEIDLLRFNLSKTLSSEIVQWISIFLPFLISCYLAYFAFYQFSKKTYLGVLAWSFYLLSTFSLFAASIDTNFITALNLFLFFVYLYDSYFDIKKNIINTIIYILLSTLTIVGALTFEMRMILVTMPFFFIHFIVITLNNKPTLKKIVFITFINLIVGILVASNFIYLFLNYSSILHEVSLAVSRSTWGNAYFNILNTLTLSHPFWNDSSPVNFIYNIPSIWHLSNIIVIAIILFVTFKKAGKNFSYLYLFPFLFFLFLSKENNVPFQYVFDYLYKYPYFSFSREASKYYYGFTLSLSFLAITSFRSINKKWLIYGAYVSILIPLLCNFIVFSSHVYARTTTQYAFNTQVYSEINNYIDSINSSNARVLWLPLESSLESNNQLLTQFSYSDIVYGIYPLNDIRKNSRSYLTESLSDTDLQNYLKLMNFKYVIIPNLSNEPDMASQLYILYKNYNQNSFINYVQGELNLTLIKNIDGYRIYKFNTTPTQNFEIVSTFLNPLYLSSNQIDLNNQVTPNPNITPIPTSSIKIQLNNCNRNTELGLDFNPNSRMSLVTNTNDFSLKMKANYQEVPCVFAHINTTSTSTLLININKYHGDNTELVLFNKGFPVTVNTQKILSLNQAGYLPIPCSMSCDIAIYLYGDNETEQQNTSFDFSFDSTESNTANIIDNSIYIYKDQITSLKDTKLTLTSNILDSDYLLLLYTYLPGYELKVGNQYLKPIKNNLNLLIFNINNLNNKSLIFNNSELIYQPEIQVDKSLFLSKLAFIITSILFVMVIIFKLIKICLSK
jgi:hypothetical protein